MKLSTKLLLTILLLGLLYSIYKLFTGQGGSGLGNFIDGLGYTSLLLCVSSLIIILLNIRQVKKYTDTFLFLLLGLPMTIMGANRFVSNINYNREPVTANYPRPVSRNEYLADSLHIELQVDSLIALRNRETSGIKVVSAFVDTLIYSQSGNEIFVIYAQKFEPNHLRNDLDPAYLSADKKDSVYWHLQEGPPNAEYMTGSFQNIIDLKKAVRKFFFNQYSFFETDSLKENYFWKRNSIK